VPAGPLTRFAPSPTGYLHLGHVANAIYTWGIARGSGGSILLRLEDHDRGRCHPQYEAGILEDLEWLGLEPDFGKPAEFRAGRSAYRQSDNEDRYQAALGRLSENFWVFACDCSRKDISGDADVSDRETRYPGRCRERNLRPGPGRGLRVVIDAGEERFDDWMLGPQKQDPSRQCGDLLLKDRRGNWTYQFAVTLDDLDQGIDLVVRGQDLLESTGRQIRLARMLGRELPPSYLHHPLIRHPSGAKLSKANRDTSIRDLRVAGVSPARVMGQAAHLSGLIGSPRDLEVSELAELFLPG